MYNESLSLIASFIAMMFVIVSYFVRKKTLYLLFQALCMVFLIVSYFFSVQFFAMIGIAVGLLRSITFFIYENKDKNAPLFLSFCFSAMTVAAYFSVNLIILKTVQPLDILCLSALVMYAFIFRIRNLKIVRFSMLVPTILSILFNLLTGAALFATLTYVFELGANLLSIIRYHLFGKKKS